MNDRDIKRIWDKTNKDMPFKEFAKEVRKTLDPVQAQRELQAILTKREIDRTIRR